MTNELLTRRAPAATSSLDAEAREIDAVLATESAVRRSSWQNGPYDEILAVTSQAIDTSRMDAMPFLDSHAAYAGLDARLGTVVPGSLRFEGKTAIVRVRLSRTEAGDRVLRDLQDGHRLAVSVGYKITETQRTEPTQAGGVPVIRATRWQPMELSLVSVPADAGATTRAHETEGTTVMPQTQTTDTQAITRAEKQRINTIRGLAKTAGIDGEDELVVRAIDEDMTVESFRSAMLDKLIDKEQRSPTFPHSEMRGMGGTRSMSEAVADALMTRMDARHKPQNDAREFVGLTLPEIARRCLEARGESTIGMTPAGLITRSLHSTSDFPIILADVANKRLQAEFAAVPSALKRVAKQSSARDFRAKTVAKLGSAPELLPVTEAGEYKRGTMVEASESYRVSTFGRIFGVTRQLLVNDDLGAFASAVTKLGQAAAVFEAKHLVELLVANPVMSDGKVLFHADHNNVVGSGTALDETNLSAARVSFRRQVGLAGDLVNLAPKFLIVGAELETPAEKLLTAINATKTADVNPFSGQLELVVEPRLTGKAWYLAADPATCEGLEYSYLDGFEGPYTETRQGFDTDGVEFKVRLDFGAAFLEHRSWYKNPGV